MTFNPTKLSLMGKFLIPILVSILIALLLGALMLIQGVSKSTQSQMQLAEQSLKIEQAKASEAAIKALISKADGLGRFMAQTAPDLIMSFDFTSLGDYAKCYKRS